MAGAGVQAKIGASATCTNPVFRNPPMCGRYLLKAPADALRRAFGFVEQPNLMPRYNIAPTQDAPVIRERREPKGERTLQMLRWGLIPSWVEDTKGGAKLINARA